MEASTPRRHAPAPPLQAPPCPTTADGSVRRVGVEIEFGDLEARQAATCVAAVFGGHVEEADPHAFRVVDTRFGTFTVELDSHYVHPDEPLERLKTAGHAIPESLEKAVRGAGRMAGDLIRRWIPTEVVTPPLPWDRLHEMEPLVAALRERGATGTDAQMFYAFGLQLNPELPREDAASLLAHLRAFMLAGSWLRERIGIDDLRRLLPFIDRFPSAYCHVVFDGAYAPSLEGLIGDYLAHNPTRNRGLDMLPAFSWLRPELISRALDDPLIKSRPTFHYRLPNAALAAGTPVIDAWTEWLVVERLAADPARIDRLCRSWREHRPGTWAMQSAPELEPLLREAP